MWHSIYMRDSEIALKLVHASSWLASAGNEALNARFTHIDMSRSSFKEGYSHYKELQQYSNHPVFFSAVNALRWRVMDAIREMKLARKRNAVH